MIRKERPRGPVVTNAERKRRKASPESLGQSDSQEQQRRWISREEPQRVSRGHINFTVLLVALAERKQAYTCSIFILII